MVYENYWKNKNKGLMGKYDRWREIGKALKLSREALCRLEWIIFYETKANKDVAMVCRHFGIGRSTFYKWLNCFITFNLRSLETKSCRPKAVRSRQAVACKDERVIALRKKYPYYGKKKIAVLYRKQYQENITDWYVQMNNQVFNAPLC